MLRFLNMPPFHPISTSTDILHLLSFLLLFSIPTNAFSGESYVEEDGVVHITSSLDSNKTFTEYFEKKDTTEFRDNMLSIQTYLTYMDDRTNTLIAGRQRTSDNQVLRPCNIDGSPDVGLYSAKFGLSIVNRFKNRQWEVPDVKCLTEIFGTRAFLNETPPLSTASLFEAIYRHAEILYDNRVGIIEYLGLPWDQDSDVMFRYPYNLTSRNCMVHPVSAARINESWYLDSRISRSPLNLPLPRDQYRFIEESMSADPNSGFLPPLEQLAKVKRFPNDTLKSNAPHLATTVQSQFPTFSSPSIFVNIPLYDNVALHEALDLSEKSAQLAADALTPSSVAILILPLLLNFIPLALVAQVETTLGVLIYTLTSNVVTVVPLGVKGVELIHIGRQRHRSVVTWMSSALSGKRSTTAGAQLWAAECQSQGYILRTGLFFLIAAVTSLIVGILLEYVSHIVLKRRRKKEDEAIKQKSIEFAGVGTMTNSLNDEYTVSSIGSSNVGRAGDTVREPTGAHAVEPEEKD